MWSKTSLQTVAIGKKQTNKAVHCPEKPDVNRQTNQSIHSLGIFDAVPITGLLLPDIRA